AERGADAPLRRDRVAAGGEDLGDAGGREARFREAERGPEPATPGPDHDDVIGVIDEIHAAHHAAAPNARPSTANPAPAASSACTNFDRMSEVTRASGWCT